MLSAAPLFQSAHFLLSVASAHGSWPPSDRPEVVLVGRSNVGKSSLINALTRQRALAYVSKKPGCTELVNFFAVGDRFFLVDLPGYGYAQRARGRQAEWSQLIEAYFKRPTRQLVLWVMDIRHPWSKLDLQCSAWLKANGCSVLMILNKADKLARYEVQRALKQVEARSCALFEGSSLLGFVAASALRGIGLAELEQLIAAWLADEKREPGHCGQALGGAWFPKQEEGG